jgi:PAS domain S-box-containing protein
MAKEKKKNLLQPKPKTKAPKKQNNISGQENTDSRVLLEELRIDQLELQAQNEELRLAKEEIADAHARYRELYDFAPAGYFTLSEYNIIQQVNLTACSMLGVERHGLLNRRFTKFVLKECLSEFYRHQQQVVKTGRSTAFEVEVLRSDGTKFWAAATMAPDKEGMKVAIIDISERKKFEREKRTSDERMRFALERSHIGAWDLDLKSQTTIRTAEHDRIFGHPVMLPVWTYKMFLEHVIPEDRAHVKAAFQNAVETRGDLELEFRINRADGETRWIWASARHHQDETGKVSRMAGIVRDITGRKVEEIASIDQLKTELEETKEMLDTASTSVAETTESVQNDIARELHDQIGQSLLGIGLELHGIQRKALNPEVKKNLHQMVSKINELIDNIRAICNELRPVWLDESGLTEAIEAYINDFGSRSGIICDYISPENEPDRLPDNVKFAAYRILQEALTNILRHAKATRLKVDLRFDNDCLKLSIKDNGVGMELPLPAAGSIGIRGMEERALMVDGEFDISSTIGTGTEILVKIPIG